MGRQTQALLVFLSTFVILCIPLPSLSLIETEDETR